ncbi:PQQ-binding-like beta-propeller repeat protein [Actinotalea sp. M2MS4P-6]|uniref:outer membrane protein assembly factor BamB family protein n=1 Tax=Actinotalea sp. M2MS4P-6 TaxID=2983762 RepID=UPI0021E4D545|nr:PQQ-binding-like beta-propeller repeat protein [Actinotalea sp. M2MS4P-6]MCV2393675.1 PQQ-binding-like beta-propeller repeat protein [Actinotalea sp. M2MS4P-6]
MRRKPRTGIALVTLVVGALMVPVGAAGAAGGSLWTSAGGDRQNTRYQSSESKIGPATVADLEVAWTYEAAGDVSATPAVDADTVYFPDWGGNLNAVDRLTGAPLWVASIPAITGIPGDKARATPAVTDDKVIVGTLGPLGGGGQVIAFDKFTGQVLWVTVADSHAAAMITQSATVFDGVVYVGVSSAEEALAALIPNYECCSFRGSMLALDEQTGAILWRTYTVPAGYSGGSVWGSSPAIDTKRGQVYIATGNNYSVPDDVQACVAAAGGDPGAMQACLSPNDLFDSVLALDMKTGAIRWATKAVPFDAWNVDCIPFFGSGANCPDPAGPDYDFGQAPALFSVKVDGTGKPRDVVGVGQKSGQYWALDPDSGQVVWETQTGPGGINGGLQWGSAVDGTRVYTANANSNVVSWVLPDGTSTSSGIWSALDAASGQILWQKASPTGGASGAVTTANGVVFSCTLDPQGHMYALDAATGEVLWSFASGGTCNSGASVSRGMVYWGSGYSIFAGTPNHTFYAFTLPD